jgi:hypothetical protein
MFDAGSYSPIHNDPDAYWCWDCKSWTYDCSHLVEPLSSPILKLDHCIYKEVTWHAGVIQITTNTGERYQYSGVSRAAAVAFSRNPDNKDVIKGRRLERVRGRVTIEWSPNERQL